MSNFKVDNDTGLSILDFETSSIQYQASRIVSNQDFQKMTHPGVAMLCALQPVPTTPTEYQKLERIDATGFKRDILRKPAYNQNRAENDGFYSIKSALYAQKQNAGLLLDNRKSRYQRHNSIVLIIYPVNQSHSESHNHDKKHLILERPAAGQWLSFHPIHQIEWRS